MKRYIAWAFSTVFALAPFAANAQSVPDQAGPGSLGGARHRHAWFCGHHWNGLVRYDPGFDRIRQRRIGNRRRAHSWHAQRRWRTHDDEPDRNGYFIRWHGAG